MQALIGQKKTQSQRFLENGRRIPVTLIDVKDNRVIAVRTNDTNHYQAVQLGFSMKKKASKAEVGHAKGAQLEKAPKFLKEVKIVVDEQLPEVGTVLNPTEIFAPGDIVDVSGISKGKGYAGGVKRHGFHGGPKTHGQSDRHRAPGSIGQGTTPGRVYKGKRMAGKMGNDNVTVKNLEVVDVTNDGVLVIKGLVPGIINSLIVIEKVGEDKKFVPLWKEAAEEVSEAPVEEVKAEAEEKEAVSEEKPQEEEAKAEGKTEEVATKESPIEAKTEESEEAKEEASEEKVSEERESSEARSGSAREVKEDAGK